MDGIGMIHLLDKETIERIAAGEVIERPESVAKELIDNAIDSKASRISVEIRSGGTELIRVTDDGCGIAGPEIAMAFLRHATSKLSSSEDLGRIRTMGFRGEALASICAVSRTELITKQKGELSGFRYVIEGGTEKELCEVGAPEGTTVLVRDLFYNVPARREFLKTPSTEASYVADVAEKAALSYPGIGFTYISDKKTVFATSGNGSLSEVIYTLYGREIAKNLIEFEATFEENGIRLSGFLGKPVIARSRRDFEVYFVNGRHIRSRIVERAIEEGYAGFMMQHRFPFTVFSIDIDPGLIDVNVHPKKMEIRFSDEKAVYEAISTAIAKALRKSELIIDAASEKYDKERREKDIHEIRLTPSYTSDAGMEADALDIGFGAYGMELAGAGDAGMEDSGTEAACPQETVDDKEDILRVTRSEPFETHKQELLKEDMDLMFREPEAVTQQELPREVFLSQRALPQFKLVGQVFDTYWIIEYDGAMYLIDQHAAHEKVNYERLMKRVRERRAESQYIYPPVLISLSPSESRAVMGRLEVFSELGYEIEEAGDRDIIIRAVPADLPELSRRELLMEVIDSLSDDVNAARRGRTAYESIEAKLASMSCKAAVKGNNRLSAEEMKALIAELLTLDNPYACPHGRPTIAKWTRYDLDKIFKRIV